jgi:hypothetical protein
MNKEKKSKRERMEIVSVRLPNSFFQAYEDACVNELLNMTRSQYLRMIVDRNSKETNFNLLTQR